MRRQTVTVNYSSQLSLAQGIQFGASLVPAGEHK
jgi:hypothetical protein